jgi:hypothetical protein
MDNTRRAVVLGSLGVAAASLTAIEPASAGTRDPLRDQLAIRAVLDGIDDAVDEKDWVRARAYFTNEVDVDFEALEGGPPARISADALIDGWRRNLYAEKLSFHQRTNHAIVVDGDRATVRSKGYAFNRLQRRLGDALWEVWGIYTHRLVRTSNGWRCSAIGLTTVMHAQGNELARTFVP